MRTKNPGIFVIAQQVLNKPPTHVIGLIHRMFIGVFRPNPFISEQVNSFHLGLAIGHLVVAQYILFITDPLFIIQPHMLHEVPL